MNLTKVIASGLNQNIYLNVSKMQKAIETELSYQAAFKNFASHQKEEHWFQRLQ